MVTRGHDRAAATRIAPYVRLLSEAGVTRPEGLLADFGGRLFLSKYCYLVQSVGLAGAYRFRYGFRGPYSDGPLSDLGEADMDLARELAAGMSVGLGQLPLVLWLVSVSRGVPDGATQGTWLEAVATVAYLIDRGCDMARVRDEGGSAAEFLEPALGCLLCVGKSPA